MHTTVAVGILLWAHVSRECLIISKVVAEFSIREEETVAKGREPKKAKGGKRKRGKGVGSAVLANATRHRGGGDHRRQYCNWARL